MAWDPAQYLKFAGPRLRPAIDLLGHIEAAAPKLVYDLGCGAGNVTRFIAERWPAAKIVGFDGSDVMLGKAKTDLPQIEWQEADLATWRPAQKPDVIYSNAALHWIEDHGPVFVALFNSLAPGGTFAVQIPRNFGAPSHTSMGEAARMGPWRAKLEPLLRPSPVEPPIFITIFWRRSPRSSTSGRPNICRCSRASTRSRNTQNRPGSRRCWRRWRSPSAVDSRRPTQSSSMRPIRAGPTARHCFRSAACSSSRPRHNFTGYLVQNFPPEARGGDRAPPR